MPRSIEAADLSEAAFLYAGKLLRQIRAANPDLPFRVACQRALRQAYEENQAGRSGSVSFSQASTRGGGAGGGAGDREPPSREESSGGVL